MKTKLTLFIYLTLFWSYHEWLTKKILVFPFLLSWLNYSSIILAQSHSSDCSQLWNIHILPSNLFLPKCCCFFILFTMSHYGCKTRCEFSNQIWVKIGYGEWINKVTSQLAGINKLQHYMVCPILRMTIWPPTDDMRFKSKTIFFNMVYFKRYH